MRRYFRRRCWLVGLGWLILWPVMVYAQDRPWRTYNEAGERAYLQGQYAEAEKQFLAAVKEAEAFGSQDPRLALSLSNLGTLYQARGQHAQAEPLFKRSLAIREKVLGPEHREVAQSLEDYATALRKANRAAEAAPMEARAKAIRTRHAQENPTK